jgi:hypothetical protein
MIDLRDLVIFISSLVNRSQIQENSRRLSFIEWKPALIGFDER